MSHMNEQCFIDNVTQFVTNLLGPDRETIDPDRNLIVDAGLDSLQLIAVLRHIEKLRDSDFTDPPDLENLTLRTAYQLLYRGEPVRT